MKQDQRPVILIVDDEKSNLKILYDLLRNEVKVILAKEGKQALHKARTQKPDLILLDVIMPQMDGFEVIRALKQDSETSSIPVIFISSLNDVSNEGTGFELGACDYIHKPFHRDIVRARVRLHLKLQQQRLLLEQWANIDPLTSIANRRKFDERLQTDWQHCLEQNLPLSLVMIDIDYFKQYNDSFGHAAGDTVLEQVATTLANNLDPETDLVARYGGEEFVLILPGQSAAEARQKAEVCWQAIKALRIPHQREDDIKWVTVSMGGIAGHPHCDRTPFDALDAADNMLYEAKNKGRNVIVWGNL